MKITRKTKKELETIVKHYAEQEGIPSEEVRTEIKGFMKGASSFLVSEALGNDELGMVADNNTLRNLQEEAQKRFSNQMNLFHQQKRG